LGNDQYVRTLQNYLTHKLLLDYRSSEVVLHCKVSVILRKFSQTLLKGWIVLYILHHPVETTKNR